VRGPTLAQQAHVLPVPNIAQPTQSPSKLLWECNTRQQHSGDLS
jgi:hypothetical protein